MNFEDLFVGIRVMNNAENIPYDFYMKMMKCNYHLGDINVFSEEMTDEDKLKMDEAYEASKFLVPSDLLDPNEINSLKVGAMFKGITKTSMQYTYIVIAEALDEYQKRTAIIFPINGIDSTPEPVAILKKFNFEADTWDTLSVNTYEEILDTIYGNENPGGFYHITDLSGEPVDIFNDDEYDSNGIYYCAPDKHHEDNFTIHPLDDILDILPFVKDFMVEYKRLTQQN